MVGLVTVDDLLAELVGEIADESDVDEQIIKRVDKQTIIVHGEAEIRAINRFFNVRIPGPSNKTVSRLILEKLGDIPQAGQSLSLDDGLSATVEQIANLRIARIRLTKNVS
jgi:CBS domain containing-hemolysin-like protein